MYHKATFTTKAYYDTINELPKTATVYFPEDDNRGKEELTADEMMILSEQGYYFIEHSCNYGSCDHWVAKPLRKFVQEYFLQIIHYIDDNTGNTIGYDRKGTSVRLTKDSTYWKSEVWNS